MGDGFFSRLQPGGSALALLSPLDEAPTGRGNLSAPACSHRRGLPGPVTEEARPRVALIPAKPEQAEAHPDILNASPVHPPKNSQERHGKCSTPKPLYTGEAGAWVGVTTGQWPGHSPRSCLSRQKPPLMVIKPAIRKAGGI